MSKPISKMSKVPVDISGFSDEVGQMIRELENRGFMVVIDTKRSTKFWSVQAWIYGWTWQKAGLRDAGIEAVEPKLVDAVRKVLALANPIS
jgi:hypothetical protein